jgi:hypothetical protein
MECGRRCHASPSPRDPGSNPEREREAVRGDRIRWKDMQAQNNRVAVIGVGVMGLAIAPYPIIGEALGHGEADVAAAHTVPVRRAGLGTRP